MELLFVIYKAFSWQAESQTYLLERLINIFPNRDVLMWR